MDIESLYPSIQHEVGLQTVMYFLDKQMASDHGYDSLLLDLLEFVLKQNYFIFQTLQWEHVVCSPMPTFSLVGEGRHTFPLGA